MDGSDGNDKDKCKTPETESTPDDFKSLTNFIFGEPDNFFEGFVEFEKTESALRPSISGFKEHLKSVLLVGSIPFQLTQSAVINGRFDKIHMAERIRTLKRPTPMNQGDEYELNRQAHRIAVERINEEMHNPDIINAHSKEILKILDSHLSLYDFKLSADELLRQLLIMIWGALETLINDSIRIVLNERPELISSIISVKENRLILFGNNNLLQALQKNGFDISNVMGDVFCDSIKLDSVVKIRECIKLLLDDDSLNAVMKSDRIWLVAQQRHLIVHRRGIIDQGYLDNTSDKAQIGERIAFTSTYIEEITALVRDVGVAFIRSCISKLEASNSECQGHATD